MPKKDRRKYHKEYRIKNKDRIRKYSKNYNKLYYEKNKDRLRRRSKDYYQKNKDRCLAAHKEWCRSAYKNTTQYQRYGKKHRLKSLYGLTTQEYEEMIRDQNGLCAVCEKYLNPPHVDHCHNTGKVRGLLCLNCNAAIGQAGEDINRLRLLIEYLEKHQLA